MGRVWAQAPDIQVEESLSGVQAENLPRGLPGTPGSLTSGVSDSCSSCGATDGCSGLSPTARLPGRESACPSCPAARYLLPPQPGPALCHLLGPYLDLPGFPLCRYGDSSSLLTPRVDGSGALGAGAEVLGLPPYLEGPKAQDPQKKCSDGLATVGAGYGSQVSGTWWEQPRPRSSPEAHTFPSSLASDPACPTSCKGPCQPRVGAPRLAGQRPSLPTRGLWVLPAHPHVGARWLQACVFGRQRRDQVFTSPFAASSSSFVAPQQLASDAEEVCLASQATSAVAPLPPPRPHPPKFPSDTQLRIQPLIISSGPPHTPCPGRQSDPASAA